MPLSLALLGFVTSALFAIALVLGGWRVFTWWEALSALSGVVVSVVAFRLYVRLRDQDAGTP
jgi:hypothetical protein